MAKVLLRNDYWCKGLGQGQPKSDAWKKFKTMKAEKKIADKKQKEKKYVLTQIINGDQIEMDF